MNHNGQDTTNFCANTTRTDYLYGNGVKTPENLHLNEEKAQENMYSNEEMLTSKKSPYCIHVNDLKAVVELKKRNKDFQSEYKVRFYENACVHLCFS